MPAEGSLGWVVAAGTSQCLLAVHLMTEHRRKAGRHRYPPVAAAVAAGVGGTHEQEQDVPSEVHWPMSGKAHGGSGHGMHVQLQSV